jgi:peptidoglycan/LPS O-acetylase OafA/YrhL
MATSVAISDARAGLFETGQTAFAARPPRTAQATSKRPQYMFVHTVRFWSMLAIVMLHGVSLAAAYARVSFWEAALLTQVFKFGTIAFFLISGFLLGDRLPADRPLSYLRRRANRLLPAWAVWFGLLVAFFAAAHGVPHATAALSPGHLLANEIYRLGIDCFIGTALWFVPNFMVALTCLVLLRRWLNDLRLGAVLLAINLFYGVNVYLCWIPSRHTEAFFGFVFYLWLGAWCALRKERLQQWAAALSGRRLLLCVALACAAALLEARMLLANHSIDPMNSLRFANQVYSVLMTILLLRVRRVTWPRFVDVGAHTYGVYLSHTMLLTAAFAAAGRIVIGHGHRTGPVGFVVMWALLAPTSYLLSLLLTRWIATSRWPWLVGAASPRAEKAVAADTRPNRLEALPAAR